MSNSVFSSRRIFLNPLSRYLGQIEIYTFIPLRFNLYHLTFSYFNDTHVKTDMKKSLYGTENKKSVPTKIKSNNEVQKRCPNAYKSK